MAAYHVGTNSTGDRTWWDYQGRGFEAYFSDVREATAEEATLMGKIIWGNHTSEDIATLKELIAR